MESFVGNLEARGAIPAQALPPDALFGEPTVDDLLEFVECFRADVVLNPFSVDGRGFRINSDLQQKLVYDFVPLPTLFRQFRSVGCELNRLIGLCCQQAFTDQSCNNAIRRHVADSEPFS